MKRPKGDVQPEDGLTKPILRARTNLWFLVQIKKIVDFEEELAGAKN